MSRSRRLLVLLLSIAVGVLAVDQVTKVWAVQTLSEGERTPLLGDLLGLTLLYNPGAALSIATGMTWVFTLAAVAVTVVVLRISARLGSRTWAVALGLLLGGAVGNLADRLLREPGFAVGHVVDFIAYGDLFVGNVADIAIVVAAGLVILLSLRGIAVDGTREGHASAESAASGADLPGVTVPGGGDVDVPRADATGTDATGTDGVAAARPEGTDAAGRVP